MIRLSRFRRRFFNVAFYKTNVELEIITSARPVDFVRVDRAGTTFCDTLCGAYTLKRELFVWRTPAIVFIAIKWTSEAERAQRATTSPNCATQEVARKTVIVPVTIGFLASFVLSLRRTLRSP